MGAITLGLALCWILAYVAFLPFINDAKDEPRRAQERKEAVWRKEAQVALATLRKDGDALNRAYQQWFDTTLSIRQNPEAMRMSYHRWLLSPESAYIFPPRKKA